MSFGRLLLVVPPQSCVLDGFRTALVALASYVRRRLPAIEVVLLDLSITRREELRSKLQRLLAERDTRTAVAISTVTADYQSALRVATTVKELDKSVVVIMGGHHASGDARVIVDWHRCNIDFVVKGEGEIALTELLANYPDAHSVPGLVYVDPSGRIVENPPPRLLTTDELDEIPVRIEGLDVVSPPGKFEHATYVSARGCPLKCAFCAVSDDPIRHKSIPQVVSDIRQLVEIGHTKIAFEDNFFANSRRRTHELCEALSVLRREMRFSWDCQTRVESLVRPETISFMQEAGCEAVYLGVESLDPGMLRYLRKTANPERYLSVLEERVVPALLDSSIDCFMNLQFGYLQSDQAQIEANVAQMARLGALAARRRKTITVFPQLFVVYPGTDHFRSYRDAKILPQDVFESFTEWEERSSPVLKWMGNTFAHGTGGIPLGIMSLDGLTNRKFEVDEQAIRNVENVINRIDGLEGVTVFRYGRYLVKDGSDAYEADAQKPPKEGYPPRLVVGDRADRRGVG